MDDHSYTIKEFCEAERMSRGQFYAALREGWGPRYFRNGTHMRISADARREWREAREAAARREERFQ